MTHYPTPPGVRQWRVNLDIDRPDQGPRTRLERVRRTLLSRLPCGDYFRWAYHGGRPTGLGDCDLQSPMRRTHQRERGTRYPSRPWAPTINPSPLAGWRPNAEETDSVALPDVPIGDSCMGRFGLIAPGIGPGYAIKSLRPLSFQGLPESDSISGGQCPNQPSILRSRRPKNSLMDWA